MKRSILLSLLVIGAVTALMGFTIAQFSDTETSNDNTISTSSLNLQLGTTTGGIGNCVYTDPFVGPFFNFTNAAPGDTDEVTICVKNDGNIDGLLDGDVYDLTDVEVGACNEPEAAAPAEVVGTCADGNAGELSGNVLVDIWVEGDCNNVNADDTLDGNRTGGELWFFSGNMDELDAFVFPTGDMPGGSEWCYGVEATVDATAGNEIQTDEVTADITFTLTQAP